MPGNGDIGGKKVAGCVEFNLRRQGGSAFSLRDNSDLDKIIFTFDATVTKVDPVSQRGKIVVTVDLPNTQAVQNNLVTLVWQ